MIYVVRMSQEDQSLDQAYARMRPAMERAGARLRALLLDVIGGIEDRKLVRAEIDDVRIKELASLKRKARKAGWEGDSALWGCSDLIAGRVVCNNVEDVYRFEELLKERLPAEGPIGRQDHIKTPTPQGYRALHLDFRLNVAEDFGIELLPCEVQIRSRLQDAWAELVHGDVYKQGRLPRDLRDRANDLAKLLATADEIATGIRARAQRVTTPPKARPKLDRVSSDGLAFVFKDVFGRAPPDYVVVQALNACDDLGIASLTELPKLLNRQDLRSALDRAHRAFLPGAIPRETIFLAALHALAKGDRRAVGYVRKLAQQEWKEIDATARRDMLAALPDTVDELIAELDDYSGESNPTVYAEALDATHECARCGTGIVEPYAFAESVVGHYGLSGAKADHATEHIVKALYGCGIEIGSLGSSSYCCYCADQMAKDD